MDTPDLKKSLEGWRKERSESLDKSVVKGSLLGSMDRLEKLANDMEFLQTPWVSVAYDLLPEAAPVVRVGVLGGMDREVRNAASIISDRLEAVGLSAIDADHFNGIDNDILNSSKEKVSPAASRLLDALAFSAPPVSVDGEVRPEQYEVGVARARSKLLGDFDSQGAQKSYEERMQELGGFAVDEISKLRDEIRKGNKVGLKDEAAHAEGLILRAEALLSSNTRPQVSAPSGDAVGQPAQERRVARQAHQRVETLTSIDKTLVENLKHVEMFAPMDDPDMARHVVEEVTVRTFRNSSGVYLDKGAISSPIVRSMLPSIEKQTKPLGARNTNGYADRLASLRELMKVDSYAPGFRAAHALASAVEKFWTVSDYEHAEEVEPFDPKEFWKSVTFHGSPKVVGVFSQPAISMEIDKIFHGKAMPSSSTEARDFIESSRRDIEEEIKAQRALFHQITGKDLDQAITEKKEEIQQAPGLDGGMGFNLMGKIKERARALSDRARATAEVPSRNRKLGKHWH